MGTDTRINFVVSGLTGLLAIVLAFGVSMGLGSLPELPFFVDSTLVVRKLETQPNALNTLKKGDRIVAVEGYSVYQLSGLRDLSNAILRNASGEGHGEGVQTNFLILRPKHRVHLDLSKIESHQGSKLSSLNPEDSIVAIDGRVLPNPMGIEAIRDIASSRDSGVLTILQQDQLMSGTGMLKISTVSGLWYWGGLLLYLFMLAGFAWFRGADSENKIWGLFHLETLMLFSLFLFFTYHQWVISEPVTTFLGMASLTMIRPLGLLLKQFSEATTKQGQSYQGYISVILGIFGVILVFALWLLNIFRGADAILYLGAMFGGLYIVYEIFVVGFQVMNQSRQPDLYLVGLLIIALFTGFIAWYLKPFQFNYADWRWFVLSIGGVALAKDGFELFGPSAPEPVSSEDYASGAKETESPLSTFFDQLESNIPGLNLFIAIRGPASIADSGLAKASNDPADGFSRWPLSEKIVELLRRLEPRGNVIPEMGSGHNKETTQHRTVAESLEIELAYPLRHTEESTTNSDFWIVGLSSKNQADSDNVSPELFDEINEAYNQRIENSILLKATSLDLQTASNDRFEFIDSKNDLTSEITPALIRKLEKPPSQFEKLLESELREAIEYLNESSDPIVLVGRYRSGKSFAARCASAMEKAAAPLVELDISQWEKIESQSPLKQFLIRCEEDSYSTSPRNLFIRSAKKLSDETLIELTHWARSSGRRIYFAFDISFPEESSPLEHRTERVESELGHRELIIPRLGRRNKIIGEASNYFLEVAENKYHKETSGFSEESLKKLRNTEYPGGFVELRLIIERAVKELSSNRAIEPSDLGFSNNG